MGAKGPLAVVNATEWIRRTALTLSSRSASTRRVDAAYTAWCTARFDQLKAATLRDALDDYVAEKGGVWSRVPRNTESGGLMEYIFREATAVAPPRPSAAAARSKTKVLRITDADHNDLFEVGGEDLYQRIRTFAADCLSPAGDPNVTCDAGV